MNKKLLLLPLAAMLALSSCAKTSLPVEKDGPKVFRIEGELPDIGEYSGKEKVSYHPKASDEFVPDDSYGTLVPFIGRIKEFGGTSFGADVAMTYSSQGLCTADGQIVVEPFEGYVSYNDYYEDFPYYQLTPYSDEMAEMMMQGDSVIIPVDGSWKLDLPAGSWVCDAGDGILSVLKTKPDSYEFDALACYDYDGNLLFEVPGVWSAGSFSQGYSNIHIDQDERSACYIDKNGNIVSDRYQYCSAFNENGIAYVIEYDGLAYLIDTEFNRISEIYDNIYFYSEDYITARGADFTDVISPDGQIVATIDDIKFVNVFGSGENMIYSYFNGETDIYKNLDGTRFVNEKGQSPNYYVQANGYFSHKDASDNTQSIFDSTGRIIAVLENCDSVMSVLEDDGLIVYSKGSYEFEEFEDGRPIYTNPIRTAIYDIKEQKDIVECDGYGGVSFAGEDERYFILSVYGDYDFGGSTAYYLFDTKTREFVFSDCLMIEYYDVGDGYFAVGSDSFCTLYDGEFKKVLRLINE